MNDGYRLRKAFPIGIRAQSTSTGKGGRPQGPISHPDPFHVHTESADAYVDIQKAARRIAEFVGLTGLTFLIEPTHLAEGTCGRIEPQSGGSEVLVQIFSNLFGFSSAVLATISHEIAHKFL